MSTPRRFPALLLLASLTACSPAASGDQDESAPAFRPLPTGATADYQLGGHYEPGDDVDVVIRDREAPSDAERYSVCYVNTFQTQPGELDWWEAEHPDLLLRDDAGRLVEDPDWPGEVLLDLRTEEQREELETVVTAWFEQCAQDGYAAVEPDNLDSWSRSEGLLRPEHTELAASRLTAAAHRAGLAIAQKNAVELDGRGLGFDFAIAEECEVYEECGTYLEQYPGRVVEIEYTDNGREAYTRACEARAGEHPIQLRDRDLLPARAPEHVAQRC